MAETYSNEQATINSGNKVDSVLFNGRVRLRRATITLASQAINDTIVLCDGKRGEVFVYGVINISGSAGSSTIEIGTSDDTDKYRAAATKTSTAPELFGKVASQVQLTADEKIIATIKAAALPASGTLTIDMYFSTV
jgi:hypothetical protein